MRTAEARLRLVQWSTVSLVLMLLFSSCSEPGRGKGGPAVPERCLLAEDGHPDEDARRLETDGAGALAPL
jgi:hypothetical protein